MDEETSRYAANGLLGQTLKEFGKLNEKPVTGFVFGIPGVGIGAGLTASE